MRKTDKGGKFATLEALLEDATHGAIVSELGGYWKVENGKLYFGDLEVVSADKMRKGESKGAVAFLSPATRLGEERYQHIIRQMNLYG